MSRTLHLLRTPAPTWPELSASAILSSESLRETASLIRDVLDPKLARDGPDQLSSLDAQTIHNVLAELQRHHVSLLTIRQSRIHLAVQAIAGKATRWPPRLVDAAESVVNAFESQHGPIRLMKPMLFDRGGRLWRVCRPGDVSKADLLARFKHIDPNLVDDERAYTFGSLGMTVGKWWISSIFAFRDGVIDQRSMTSGICHNGGVAYAIILKNGEEVKATTAENFSLRTEQRNPGFQSLTSHASRPTARIRVFRTHSLTSIWAPVAGIRYDGLYRITGWTLLPCKWEDMKDNALTLNYEVHFQRMDNCDPAEFLDHPLAHEVDDYKAYKHVTTTERIALKGLKQFRRERLKERELEEQRARASFETVHHAPHAPYASLLGVAAQSPGSIRSTDFFKSAHKDEPMDYFSIPRNETSFDAMESSMNFDGHASDNEDSGDDMIFMLSPLDSGHVRQASMVF